MNTPTISAALPASPASPGRVQTDANTETNAENDSFSSVLTKQQTPAAAAKPAQDTAAAKPAQDTAAAVPAKSAAGGKNNQDPVHAKPEAAENADEKLAESASEQGLSLPQIALSIAAEAALTVAAQQPAAIRTAPAALRGSPATVPAASTTLPARGLPAMLADTIPAAKPAATQAQAVSLLAEKNPALLRASPPAPDTASATAATATTGKAIQLPVGFLPVQEVAAAPHQTELTTRKASAPTGAQQTQLAVQAQLRAADAEPGKAATATVTDFATVMADMASRANSSAPAAHVELNTAQASAIAAGGAPAPAAALSAGTSPAINTAAQPALPGIATPLQNPQWASDFGRQFITLAKGGHNMPHTAELRLDPPELGPLRISINISDNVAHAIFTSAHAAVRQTVENALPQLQQLLAQAGISLGQTSVNDQGQSEQAFSESFGGSRKPAVAAVGDAAGDTADISSSRAAARNRAPDALVDTFA